MSPKIKIIPLWVFTPCVAANMACSASMPIGRKALSS
ncbi:Uncharacterised protein [Vibrio cholerae]|uniref:Lipoprotein n=1 Tax=Vibrio cholerae TaxID=666 RepID=A0A655XRI6_VIBCL|nr:Uncharacterised protein [Vibrio cholerae]